MLRRGHAARWFLAMAVLGVIHQVGSTAQAGLMVSGGGIKKFGDPFYFYIVEVSLDPGFQVELFDNFTLHELGGVHDPGPPRQHRAASPAALGQPRSRINRRDRSPTFLRPRSSHSRT